MGKMSVKVIKSRESTDIKKAEVSTQVTAEDAIAAGDWITPPLEQAGLKAFVDNSTILPQCIRAYRSNIAGYGIGVRYMDDIEESLEAEAEFKRAEEVIELLNTECDTKEIFENVIEARETYGIAYIEVIRNLAGEVTQIEFIRETPTISRTKPLDPYIPTQFWHHGEVVQRRKRFCKFRQQLNGKTVYFKEFGDPRIMDLRTGAYVDSLDIQWQANEILDFPLGTEPYGKVRWIGQILGADGSRKAEVLNNNYFENGRHTPMMIILKGGTLTEDSYTELQHYMDDIKGLSGQHSFMLLETESLAGRTDFDPVDKPDVEIKDLANILQKDELFQDYIDNHRRKVQSAFLLPDLYVGYTADFNRATAQTAQEVTEKQVFQPERFSLAWTVNNRLLNGYQFKYVEAYFMQPDTTNMDDLYRLLTVANNAGGLTPNKAKEVLYSAMGEVSDDYNDDWGNVPLAVSSRMSTGMENMLMKSDDTELVAIMKEVRKMLGDGEEVR